MTAKPFHMPLGRDAGSVLFGLVCLVAVAWMYLLAGAGLGMEQMDMDGGSRMLMQPEWTSTYAALVFFMWAIMMVAMMLPSAAPAILQVIDRPNETLGIGGIRAALHFTAGYLMIWIGFSVVATFLQWALSTAGLLSEEAMAIRKPRAEVKPEALGSIEPVLVVRGNFDRSDQHVDDVLIVLVIHYMVLLLVV